jgi:hypothetical protein
MTIIEIVGAILKWAVLLAEKFGHTNDDLKAEIERQLSAELPSSAAWAEHQSHLPEASDR